MNVLTGLRNRKHLPTYIKLKGFLFKEPKTYYPILVSRYSFEGNYGLLNIQARIELVFCEECKIARVRRTSLVQGWEELVN